jgi:hypothetical protein
MTKPKYPRYFCVADPERCPFRAFTSGYDPETKKIKSGLVCKYPGGGIPFCNSENGNFPKGCPLQKVKEIQKIL